MGMRQMVADAINAAAIPGITASPYPPPVRYAGALWTEWAGSTTEQVVDMGRVAAVVGTWRIRVVLPDDHPQKQADATDTWLPAVAAAVSALGALGDASPERIDMGDGITIPVLQIEITI